MGDDTICDVCSEETDDAYDCAECGAVFCTECGDSEKGFCHECNKDEED